MARMTGFVFQDEYLERLAKLSDQEVGRLVRALAKYHATGETQELAGRESIAYDFIKVDIDRIDQRYEAKCETNSNNRKRSSTFVVDRQPVERNDDKDKEKDKVKDKDKVVNRRFTPPTRDEVAAYIAEKGYNVDPDHWMAHYESNGWKVGSNPMKDWRAAVRTWARNDMNRPRQDQPRKVTAQQYEQRQYSKAEDDAIGLEWMDYVKREGTA